VSQSKDSKSLDVFSTEAGVQRAAAKKFRAAGLRRALRHTVDSMFSRNFSDKLTLGSEEGAQWTLRTGTLNRDSVVYSGGVGGDISFELQLVERFGLSVVVFDPSPIALETIRRNSQHAAMQRIEFLPVGLASESKRLLFEPSNVPGEWQLAAVESPKSRAINCTTVAEEMEKRGHKKVDLLKLDIEGFEYQVLGHCLKNGVRIDQVCVEFHDFLPDISRRTTLEAILGLRKDGFRMIHKHRHDFTFVRSEA
jgi:FkbM family methyltransferase